MIHPVCVVVRGHRDCYGAPRSLGAVLLTVYTCMQARRGGLASCPAEDMLATLFKRVFSDTGVDPACVGDVVIGSVLGPSSQRANQCRIAMFLAGMPQEVPVHTVNRRALPSAAVFAILVVIQYSAAGRRAQPRGGHRAAVIVNSGPACAHSSIFICSSVFVRTAATSLSPSLRGCRAAVAVAPNFKAPCRVAAAK